jgi:alpha-amylase/alpha-mannosidase (GH57 family)
MSSTNRFLCIHAHFYQPARENPWLEAIEVQDSAYPYHDWNERIHRECYAPNAAARILDPEGKIVRIVNNYSRISFNFGPTLLAWMRQFEPATYQAVLEADRQSLERFGHGSAIAQGHGHLILPLANERDKRTQVLWAIRDFEFHFGRHPEGLWLPETAVDLDTLEVLAEFGIRFTILAPHQAHRVRPIGSLEWNDVTGARVDPSQPYLVNLPSGRSMNLFFYDGPISRAVAFERLLATGERFINRLIDGFSPERSGAQLVNIATDGETYGHHHRYGDMALAWALDEIDRRSDVSLTNYGTFLEQNPPTEEVEIYEMTSWSCAHGIDRWRSDCGCETGGKAGWHQRWRQPLRSSLNWLRDTLVPLYEEKAGDLFRDPWQARDDYVSVINDRSYVNVAQFLKQQADRELSQSETVQALKLLEMQRVAILMFTSCGWFFNELSGIEAVQVLQYAGRALQLAEELGGSKLEEEFLERLEAAKSNIPEQRDGRQIYLKQVEPLKVDLIRVGAHFAIASLFQRLPPKTRIYGYVVNRDDYHVFESGRSKIAVGRATVASEVTQETAVVSFGVLYMGEVSVVGGVRPYRGEDEYNQLMEELSEPLAMGDFAAVSRLLDEHFGKLVYSIHSLFRDEQRKILDLVWRSMLDEAEVAYRQLYDRYVPLVQFHSKLQVPLPKVLRVAAEFAINMHLRADFERGELSIRHVQSLVKQAKAAKIPLDDATLAFALRGTIEALVSGLAVGNDDIALTDRIESALDVLPILPFEVDLWKAQNIFEALRREQIPALVHREREGDDEARKRLDFLRSVGSRLGFQED